MRKLTRIFLLVLLLFALRYPLSAAYGAVPHLINYQGRLTDTSGKPLEGSYSVTFRIYDAETAGSMLWEETHTGLVIQKGIFSVLLGSVTNLGLAFDKQYYLEIKVGTEVMSPRQRITSAGYAVRAEEAEKLGGKSSTDYALASDITSSPTANKAVKLDTNAKLPLSALKVYDSGWFAVAANTSYSKTHNLGTTKVLTQLYLSNKSDGSGICTLAFPYSYTVQGQCIVESLSTNVLSVRTNNTIFDLQTASGRVYPISGYARIIMIALE